MTLSPPFELVFPHFFWEGKPYGKPHLFTALRGDRTDPAVNPGRGQRDPIRPSLFPPAAHVGCPARDHPGTGEAAAGAAGRGKKRVSFGNILGILAN